MYAVPYFGSKRDPAVVISFVTLGNVFPVTENNDQPDNLSGYLLFLF